MRNRGKISDIRKKENKVWRWLFTQSAPVRGKVFLLMAGDFLISFCMVGFAYCSKYVIDSAVEGDWEKFSIFAGVLLGIMLARFALGIFINGTGECVRLKISCCLRESMLACVLGKEYGASTAFHSGELLNRMFSDTEIISRGIAGLFPGIVRLITRIGAASFALIFLDADFTALLLCAGGVLFLFSAFLRKKVKQLHRNVQEKEGIMKSIFQEILGNLLITKSFCAENVMEMESAKRQREYFDACIRKRNFSLAANAGLGLLMQCGYLLALLWGGVGILKGTLTYGTMTALLQMVGQIQTPFAALSGTFSRVYEVLSSAERLMELQKLPAENEEYSASEEEWAAIETEEVDFSYENRKVLEGCSFKIKKGDMTALVGESGGGKSTVFYLLLGIYRPEKGRIFLRTKNGVMDAGKKLRGLCAYVPQGNLLFSGTIRENVAFFQSGREDSEIWRALEIACAKDFVKGLPSQLETRIGERGMGLSEGQRQRLAIARAMLMQRPILLLDEATSALDGETEKKILENIVAQTEKTCIFVTHRTAALDICTVKLELIDGKIIQNITKRRETQGGSTENEKF